MIGVKEENPELVFDDIERNLSAANRPLDKTLDKKPGVIQQEAVARIGRNSLVYLERVRSYVRFVRGQFFNFVVGSQE